MNAQLLPQGQPQVGITDLFASFEDVCEQICRRLPEGWLIRIGIDSGWAGVTLVDPDDEEHDMGECGEMLTEQLKNALDKANDALSGPRGGEGAPNQQQPANRPDGSLQ